jgi:serine phosphatase RsbU (regulator of sigma subunit)/ketosteroid isomerase-like protein
VDGYAQSGEEVSMSIVAIAGLAAALGVAVVLAAVSARRARRERRRLEILGEVARVAERGRSLEQSLEEIAAILVPELGDFCAIDMIEEKSLRRAAVRAAGPDAAEVEAGLATRAPILQERMVEGDSRKNREPRFFERVSEADLREAAADGDDLDFLRRLGVRSGIAVELRARGKTVGALSIGVSHSGRRFGTEEPNFIAILAGRVALALDNAGLFSELERSERERAEIAETLQLGLLPPPLPHIPGWSLATTYRPVGAENELGGDFYDAFRIAHGWMVVVGDVTGRGAKAAAVTAHARYTLRTAASLTGDPVIALRTLNRELLARRGGALCSVAALAIDEEEPTLRLAVAGHPPPLIIGGGVVREAASAGPVLGAFAEGEWAVESMRLRPGETIVVITDGVTEAVGERERFGERRLHDELRDVDGPAVATQKLEGALQRFSPGEPDDDAAIVAVAPATAVATPAPEAERGLVERLFSAFNRRDGEEIVELCDPEMEFFAAGTAEAVGRRTPYVGPAGLQDYLRDIEKAWDELLITPSLIETSGGSLLVRGRVYARSRLLGIRDVPVAWIWELAGGQFVRGEVFTDPEQAVSHVAAR